MLQRRAVAVALCALLAVSYPSHAAPAVSGGPTPGVACAAGSHPEVMQGRAPGSDVATGRAALGYTCNSVQAGHYGLSGGYRVERYVDTVGHQCAFYDSDTFVGNTTLKYGPGQTGVFVLDMHNPAKPVRTAVLRTVAMQSPHESLRLNPKRGLLAAALSTASFGPGIIDIYDVRTNCLKPTLLSTSPVGVLGHESAFAPDGNTFYVSSLNLHSLAAIDIKDPTSPNLLWETFSYGAHGMSVSLDGKRLYMADVSDNGFSGLKVLDVSSIQNRSLLPNPTVVSQLTWPQVSIPQNATPFTRHGHPYVMEVDEFGEGITGAARIIDIKDEKHPFVASNLRLKVNQPEVYDSLQNDPGNSGISVGYQAHYCTLPSRIDPNIVACSFLMSGLRVFDIRNPARPVELAYFNKVEIDPSTGASNGGFTMSAPTFDPARHTIWYADDHTGFYAVRLVGAAARIPFAGRYVQPGS